MTEQDHQRQEIESWKRKYYDSLDETERKEKDWRRLDELLRRALSRLTLAADGLDSTLDEQLKALRDVIRDKGSQQQLETRIEAMSASLVKLDSRRAGAGKALSGIDVMELVLDKAEFPKTAARQRKALQKKTRQASEEQLPELVDEFAALLHIVLDSHAETVPAAAGGGLLDKLFHRDNRQAPAVRNHEQPAAPVPPERPVDHTPGQREMLLHLLERLAGHRQGVEIFKELRERVMQARGEQELKRLADTLVEGLAGVPRSGGEAAEQIVQLDPDQEGDVECDFRDALVQLLERLAMPASFEARVDSLKERLEDHSAPLETDTVMCDMAELVAEMRVELQREKSELEEFLQQLSSRLQAIDSVVVGAEDARQASFENGRALGDKVHEQVQGIRSRVAEAEEMEQLKLAVQVSVETIIAHVEQHRTVEDERNQAAQREVQLLRTRLAELEKESAELRSKVHRERNQALTDALTGIPNRLAWDERISQEYARWKRFGTPLALLVWDVDKFKQVNDEYGHKAGDKVLKVIAGLLEDNIRETDFLARYGGEEFVLLMTGAATTDVAAVAEKLRHAIEDCGFHYKGQQVPVTISCGMTLFRPGDTVEAAFERADKALYRAKELGRNRCESAD